MFVHIVEDDPGVGDSLALLLAQIGHESRVYPDAESFFECHPPDPEDTVIVDLGLPGLSGMQVVRWLSGLKTPPKVIAITGQPSRAPNLSKFSIQLTYFGVDGCTKLCAR